jgi:integrase
MRWSGLRIRDAITLERTRLIGDNLMLYQAKTGTPVYVPLPPQVAEALRNIPDGSKPNARYFFLDWEWTGSVFGTLPEPHRQLSQAALRKTSPKNISRQANGLNPWFAF